MSSTLIKTQVDLTLNTSEYDLCLGLARQRTVIAIHQGLKRRALGGKSEDNWLHRYLHDLEGVLGELAVAKWLGNFFIPRMADDNSTPDIPPDIEARGTSLEHGNLLIRQDDHADRRYILAITLPPIVTLVGWCWGHEVQDIAWTKPNPSVDRLARKVTRDRLRGMEEFER